MKLVILSVILGAAMASRYPNIIPAYPAYSDPVYLPDTPKPAHRTSTYFKPMHDLISPIEITKPRTLYDFAYTVKDEPSENNFGHREASDGKVVSGTYFVNLPDGRLQTVQYKADDHGYIADVKYDKKPDYQEIQTVFSKTGYPRMNYPTAVSEPRIDYEWQIENFEQPPVYSEYEQASKSEYKPKYPIYPSYLTAYKPALKLHQRPAYRESDYSVNEAAYGIDNRPEYQSKYLSAQGLPAYLSTVHKNTSPPIYILQEKSSNYAKATSRRIKYIHQ